ncbi:hypothetical protein RDWZM_008219 [Blomia tropicalis]|uniref:PDZ domain-containing protein n=1 Tax=Blomia tropicalis TaxID=40697 RepID=A0A9Q0M379_BLOTA|nr:hypothetical protein RDWZM_008219 [Blomia tropicalis]
MATKTLFITLSRKSPDIPWGFTLAEGEHRRLHSPLVVQNIQSSSAAYNAGLLPGDIVLGVDNSPITGRPLTYSLAIQLINSARHSIELQILREPFIRVKRQTMYQASPEPISRPSSVASHAGKIPSVAMMDSGVRIPDNNIIQYHNEKAREQWAINKQTYRTTPLIEPKPKVRRDWPTGCYLRHMEGPGWHELPKTIQVQDPKKLNPNNDPNSGLVHRQYNSPINLYSSENVQGSILPGQRGTSPAGPSPNYGHTSSSASPQPHFNARSNQQPLSVDITMSPTYQFLQEERVANRPGHSPKYSPVTGQHSPAAPAQTPYFKTLMHTLNVSDH